MKFNLLLACLWLFAIGNAQKINDRSVFKAAEAQTETMLQSIAAAEVDHQKFIVPRTFEKGVFKLIPSVDWTSGFFPGQLWYLYEATGNKHWMNKADSFTRLLEKEQWNGGTHDMGFKMYCSYGNGFRLTGNTYYKDIIIQSAKTLSTRFNKTVGCIRSWDHNRKGWQFPVIVDNMMNLELLFAATHLTGDSSYYRIAITHANTTLRNHFRPDNSSWHVVNYDTITGLPISKITHQGYADSSAWARGQAWGLYGFTMCFRETKDPRYLQQAEKIAAFIMRHPNLPADAVPYWDYNDPNIPNAPRDASAAAITAAALLELSNYSQQGKAYQTFANKILQNLTRQYRSAVGDNKGFILLHSTGHLPANSEIDVPINYADYYYLEAVLRSKAYK